MGQRARERLGDGNGRRWAMGLSRLLSLLCLTALVLLSPFIYDALVLLALVR